MTKFAESTVEAAALAWLGGLGYAVAGDPDLLDGLFAERTSPSTVLLENRLTAALARINSGIPPAAVAEALRQLTSIDVILAVDRNHRFHHAVVNGVEVEYPKGDGSIAYTHVAIVDFDQLDNNDWLAVNQFSVVDGRHHRRTEDAPARPSARPASSGASQRQKGFEEDQPAGTLKDIQGARPAANVERIAPASAGSRWDPHQTECEAVLQARNTSSISSRTAARANSRSEPLARSSS